MWNRPTDSGVAEVHLFMERVSSSLKLRKEVTASDLLEVLSQAVRLPKLHDRGLFLSLVAPLLVRQFAYLIAHLNSFKLQLFPAVKPVPRRRNEDEGEERTRKRRRARPQRQGGAAMTLEELAEQERENNNNLEPITSRQIRTNLLTAEEQEKADKSSQEADSNKSLLGPNDGFAEQVEIMNSQIQRDSQHDSNSISAILSNSTSSSHRPGAIPNLSEKLRILGEVSFEGKPISRRRVQGSALTRRKAQPERLIDDDRMTVVRAHNIQQINEELRQERRKQAGAIQ